MRPLIDHLRTLSFYLVLIIVIIAVPGGSRAHPSRSGPVAGTTAGDTISSGAERRAKAYEAVTRAHELAGKKAFAEAEKLLRDRLSADAENPYLLFELATVLSWEGQYDQAIGLYRTLLKWQPENTGLHLEIGRVLLWKADQLGDARFRQEAIQEFKTHVAVNPDDCPGLKQIGAAYLTLGETDSAFTRLSSVVRLCPDDDEAVRLLAETYAARKDLHQAVGLLRILTDKNPLNPDIRWELADFLIQSGDISSAETEYRAVLRRYPYHTGALIGLARLLQWNNLLTESKEYCQIAALWASIKNPAPFVGLGDVESRRGNWGPAVEYYRRALAIDPKNDEVRSGLRLARWMKGPQLSTEYGDYEASTGLSWGLIKAGGRVYAPGLGTLEAGYRRWRFTTEHVSERFRADYSLSLSSQITDWLRSDLGYTASDFEENPSTGELQSGWAANLTVTPLPVLMVRMGYSRIPVSESYATIGPGYYSDVFAAGIDGRISRSLSLQLGGYVSRQNGKFFIGYWNAEFLRWDVIAERADLSTRTKIEGQLSYRVTEDPVLFIRAGASVFRSVHAENLPYWTPASFPFEHIDVSFSTSSANGSRLELEARGNHVHEGSQWGCGGSASVTLPLGNALEAGASASFENVGTAVPWNGVYVGVMLRICLGK